MEFTLVIFLWSVLVASVILVTVVKTRQRGTSRPIRDAETDDHIQENTRRARLARFDHLTASSMTSQSTSQSTSRPTSITSDLPSTTAPELGPSQPLSIPATQDEPAQEDSVKSSQTGPLQRETHKTATEDADRHLSVTPAPQANIESSSPDTEPPTATQGMPHAEIGSPSSELAVSIPHPTHSSNPTPSTSPGPTTPNIGSALESATGSKATAANASNAVQTTRNPGAAAGLAAATRAEAALRIQNTPEEHVTDIHHSSSVDAVPVKSNAREDVNEGASGASTVDMLRGGIISNRNTPSKGQSTTAPQFVSRVLGQEAGLKESVMQHVVPTRVDESSPARLCMTCAPLSSVDELRGWSAPVDTESQILQASVPLPRSCDAGCHVDRPRLLVCHDYKGGYLGDRFPQGSTDPDEYLLDTWDCVDTFVYFSHTLVSIPPVVWVNAGHTHGVPVLGTFITEWEQGAKVCNELFASRQSAQHVAKQLAAIAQFFKFDGWLINIENSIQFDMMPNFLHFLHQLKVKMAAVSEGEPSGIVLWYDAVTIAGRLHHQCTLNEKNEPFFQACDGIFVDYHWREGMPTQAGRLASRSSSLHSRYDVYMGVDVFGRGTYGGGGFDTDLAVHAARSSAVSSAVFAPGWCRENTSVDLWKSWDRRLWKGIATAWRDTRSVVTTLPFYSAFNRGAGCEWYHRGLPVLGHPWYNLSLQDPQPHFARNSPTLLESKPDAGAACSVATSGYFYEQVDSPEPILEGPCSMRVFGSNPVGKQSPTELLLYKCNVRLPKKTSLVVEYSVLEEETSRVSVVAHMQSIDRDALGNLTNFCYVLVGEYASDADALVNGRSSLYSHTAVQSPVEVKSVDTSVGKSKQAIIDEIKTKIRAKQSTVQDLVSAVKMPTTTTGSWSMRRYCFSMAEVCDQIQSPTGAILTSLEVMPHHGDEASSTETMSAYLGSLMVTAVEYPKLPLQSLTASYANVCDTWPVVSNSVSLSMLLSWSPGGVDGGEQPNPGAPRVYAIWHCAQEDQQSDERLKLLGFTRSCLWKVESLPGSRDGGACTFVLQQQFWDGTWEDLDLSLRLTVTYDALVSPTSS